MAMLLPLRGLRARGGVAFARRGVVGNVRAMSALPSTFEEMEQMDPEGARYARSVKKLGKLLGNQMTSHGDAALVAIVERLRHQARRWREAVGSGDGGAAAARFETMASEVSSLKAHQLRDVARAFAHFLALSNAAEQDQRVRALGGAYI